MNTSYRDNECTMESILKIEHEKVCEHFLSEKKLKKTPDSGPDLGLLSERPLHWGDRRISGWLPRRSQRQVHAAGVQLSDKK